MYYQPKVPSMPVPSRTSLTRRSLLAATLASPLFAANGYAQTWPARAIHLMVHFPPGGITDFGARLIGEKLASALGQPVVIENRPGAGGQTGTAAAARAQPDGYTLLFATHGPLSVAPVTSTKLEYDPIKDLAPVVPIAEYGLQIIVSNALPVASIQELIDHARKNPGKLSYASPGQGSAVHFAIEHFKHVAGIDITHIPYRGSSQFMNDLISGRVDLAFDGGARPHIESGRVRMIATTDIKRDSRFPNIPTADESGVKGYKFTAPQWLLAPAGTPKEIVAQLNAAVNQILREQSVKDALAVQGLTATGGTAESISKFIVEDLALNRKIASDANLSFE